MSKASEYAAIQQAAQVAPPSFSVKGIPNVAYVTRDGRLSVQEPMDAGDALAFADWIRETFGENDQ